MSLVLPSFPHIRLFFLSFLLSVYLLSFLLTLYIYLFLFPLFVILFFFLCRPIFFFAHRYLRNADVWSQKEIILNIKIKFVINNFYWNFESQNRKLWFIFFVKIVFASFKLNSFLYHGQKGFHSIEGNILSPFYVSIAAIF
jgi:hypothetical protein